MESFLTPCPWCGAPLPNYGDLDKCPRCGSNIVMGPDGLYFKQEEDTELWSRHFQAKQDET
jgi:hypothetical protein